MSIFSNYKTIPIINVSNSEELEEKLGILNKINHKIVEIVLRKENSIDMLKYAKNHFNDFIIGVGTVYDVSTLKSIYDIGAHFIMSPGFSLELIEYSKKNNFNFIPGAITPSEIITLMEYGFTLIKIFPISYFGGIKYMRTLDSLFSRKNVKFIPTGGVNSENIKDYLKLDSVIACSSSSFIDEFIE